MRGKNNFHIKFKPGSERHNLLKTFLRLNPNLTMRGKTFCQVQLKHGNERQKLFGDKIITWQREATTYFR